MTAPHNAEQCPAVLNEAVRLVLAVAPAMDSFEVVLSTFERSGGNAAWVPAHHPEIAVIGTKGLAWGVPFQSLAAAGEPIKTEGDQRAPAGIYRIGHAFGYDPSPCPGYMQLLPGRQLCVDDLNSPLYGRIVDRSEAGGVSGEDMHAEQLYRRGLVIDYPADRAAQSGSCIFIHVWRGEGEGTAGCVAMPETSVARLQDWTAGAESVIAILPQSALPLFARCLP